MEISVSVSRPLGALFEAEMQFLTQAGVRFVDVYPAAVPGYKGHSGDLQGIAAYVASVHDAGLRVRILNVETLEALMGHPRAEGQLQAAGEAIAFAGREGIPLVRLWPQGPRQGPSLVPGRYSKAHRGGYRMDAFRLDAMRRALAQRDLGARWAHHFTESLTPETYFSNLVTTLQRLVPVAEDADVKVMLHFDDPPVPDEANLLPGIVNPLLITRVFEAVPSDHLGLLFCVGTRYESGVDVYDQIRRFGRRQQIFHVHFRNVRGTIPTAGGYEEVALDDGDLDMFQILKAFQATGYDGSLSPDHPMIFIGDEQRRASLAYHVGYMKALLSALS